MGLIGLVISLLAAVFMIIGLIPFLGWLNWIFTLPLAILGAVFNAVAITRSRSVLALAGLVLCGAVFIIGSFRLFIGCGIF
ncbi:MAG: hypothetical protein A2Y89_04480 [Chloroflexi bacterium RBG_13_51_18]|nr:MAG: hypothetical protein A2Y89_04480 [Chloroflexi bacterium RBG_13_51_18]